MILAQFSRVLSPIVVRLFCGEDLGKLEETCIDAPIEASGHSTRSLSNALRTEPCPGSRCYGLWQILSNATKKRCPEMPNSSPMYHQVSSPCQSAFSSRNSASIDMLIESSLSRAYKDRLQWHRSHTKLKTIAQDAYIFDDSTMKRS